MAVQYYERYDSPMGTLWLVGDGNALTQLRFSEEFIPEGAVAPAKMFAAERNWLDAYFRGNFLPVSFSLHPHGTPFQKRIWQILLDIPCGHSMTYGEIAHEVAQQMGKEKMSAQAAGQAVGRNPIPIIIPCHRVLGAGGALTGFSSGIDRKVWLLRHEGWKISCNGKSVLFEENEV